ncbi:MAG: hypothetical protein IKQ35_05315 [Bacilli bacterium]|nr:hypothetical protein [Bacilli bacterium]
MEVLLQLLTVIIFVLLAVLLVIFIIIGLKLIETIDNTNNILDDLEKKSKSLDGLFETVENVGDSLSVVTDKFVEGALGTIKRLFNRKKNKYEEDFEDE